MTLITLHNWPRAIAHFDADAFFASVEQALNPKLRGKPVVTGAERGIVAAASYEAKARGVKRGIPLHEVKKICPGCIFIASDYETYSIFSKRLFSIIRRFTPEVEEHSIDEAFADLTGLRRLYRSSYREIAKKVQETVRKELGITVSAGVSLSKSLAKLCSKFKKPAGLTTVPGMFLHEFLPKINISDVWGFGPNTTALLRKHGINTAYDFVKKPRSFAKSLLGKIGDDIWMELTGNMVNAINAEEKEDYASISKTKTFTPPSGDPQFVFAEAVRNLESACIKARRHHLNAGEMILYLKRSDFRTDAAEARLNYSNSSPIALSGPLKEMFTKIFRTGRIYRATGVVLTRLSNASGYQLPLFTDSVKIVKLECLNDAIDEINSRFGKHTVFMGTGLQLKRQVVQRQHLHIPLIRTKV